MKDIRGNEIRVGDLVAYGHRVGNSGALRLVRVSNVGDDFFEGLAEGCSRRAVYRYTDRAVIVERLVQ